MPSWPQSAAATPQLRANRFTHIAKVAIQNLDEEVDHHWYLVGELEHQRRLELPEHLWKRDRLVERALREHRDWLARTAGEDVVVLFNHRPLGSPPAAPPVLATVPPSFTTAFELVPLALRPVLQSGSQGTSIVFGNGSLNAAMDSFPPSADDLQDTFVAVFTGPEHPTSEEQNAMDGEDEEAERRRQEMARQRLQKEVRGGV